MFRQNKFSPRRFGPLKFIFFAVVAVGFVLVFGAIVMYLWNAILPDTVGVKPLTYWKAVGLLILAKILFGNFGGGNKAARRDRWKQKWDSKWKSKWQNMSPEDRERFKTRWKERCGKKSEEN